jgi:hypothetical protein
VPDADRVASALAGIRERHAARIKNAPGLGADPTDFRALLKAVEAALELHRRGEKPVTTHHVCPHHVITRRSRGGSQWRDLVNACSDCAVTEKYVCAHEQCRTECPDDDEWPCPTYFAITAELTGEEAGGG